MPAAAGVPDLAAGARFELPSGRVVQLLAGAASAAGPVWECGYVAGGLLRERGDEGKHRVVLRQDFLMRCHPVAGVVPAPRGGARVRGGAN